MANYRIVHGTLAANVVTTITLDQPYDAVDVLNRNGAGEIYFTTDGSTPTIGGNNCQVVPASIGNTRENAGNGDAYATGTGPTGTVVSLISAAACTFTVTGLAQ